jgi:hypothetical protein
LREFELMLWVALAVIVLAYGLWSGFQAKRWEIMPVSVVLTAMVSAGGIILVPILCLLVFQALPIELLRNLQAQRGTPRQTVREKFEGRFELGLTPEERAASPPDTATQLKNMADASSKIAEKIYTRAGVYLLVGVLIAFSGLGFFYVQSQATLNASEDYNRKLEAYKALGGEPPSAPKPEVHTPMENLTSLAPGLIGRVGVLFFIELVAFFFLRQYRAAMDEYRYFEAIKRRREENRALVTMFLAGKGDKIDFFTFIEKCSLYSDVPKLAAGETTEMLETRKLTKDEAALFEKMIDVVIKAKS